MLDNANLCSSAVLDRLNSLLEPNGYLSINEHSTDDGEARIVRPHPNFRIFMTMDSKYGELSRAMRNRAVEIFLLEGDDKAIQNDRPVVQYPLDSTMYRYRRFQEHEDHLSATLEQRFEHLGLQDNDLLAGFTKQARQGLVLTSSVLPNRANDHDYTQPSPVVVQTGIDHRIQQFSGFLETTWKPHATKVYNKLGTEELIRLRSYHPLNNELLLNHTEESRTLNVWSASMYEVMFDLYNMQQAIQDLPSARFERRKERQKLPAFLHAYWQGMVKVAEGFWNALQQDHQFDIAFLKPLRTLFWAFHALTTASTFDRATFQTYLKMLASATPAIAGESGSLIQSMSNALSKQIAVFGSDVQLTTGASSKPLRLRPTVS